MLRLFCNLYNDPMNMLHMLFDSPCLPVKIS